MKKIVLVGAGIVLLLGAILIAGASAEKRTMIQFNGQPLDGEKVIFDSHSFEFDNDNNVTSGYIPVAIGNTITETRSNLETAVGAYYEVE